MNTYEARVIADQATGRPLAGVRVTVEDAETGVPVQPYRDGAPVQLVTGAHGLITEWQTDETTRRVALTAGPVRLTQWCQELQGTAADAVSLMDDRLADATSAADQAATIRDGLEPRVQNVEARQTAIESLAELGPSTPVDGQTASLVLQPDTQTRAAVIDSARTVVSERMPRITVGPTGEHATINDALTAHPAGGVHLDLQPGLHAAHPIQASGAIKGVTISGQGRDATRVDVDGPLVTAMQGADQWTVREFHLNHTRPTNSDSGIAVTYPRRWLIDRMHITGFGGDSILYQGGLNSAINGCTFMARDATNTNGRAAIHTTALTSDPNSAATTIYTSGNYVMGGKQYGYLFENTTIGSSTHGDVAEYCEVGFRFDRSPMSVIAPYTEANGVGIEQHDCSPVFMGPLRDNPVVTWSGTAFFERRAVQIAGTHVDPGKGLLYGGASGLRDFDTAPSLRWDSQNPSGRLTGPVGSMVLNTAGKPGATLFVKEVGADANGWAPVGVQEASTDELNHPGNIINKAGKRRGTLAFNRTTNRPVWATGPAATDPWVHADGTIAHTPA